MGQYCHLVKESQPNLCYLYYSEDRPEPWIAMSHYCPLIKKSQPNLCHLYYSEDRPEPWIAMGHYCHLIKKSQRAVFFAHKACLIGTRTILDKI